MAKEFTYCGDLVGTSSIYASAPGEAYSFLNKFYNTVFDLLGTYDQGNANRKVYMFSDSLIVTGDDWTAFVTAICRVYVALLQSSLMLRGGIATGRLEFDPRKTRENFQKMLPQDDTLARANALEKSVKGARLVVEARIAHQLIGPMQEWLTLQGYIMNPTAPGATALQRSIVPLGATGSFEILYPVHEAATVDEAQLRAITRRLDYLAHASPHDALVHYRETLGLIKHSQERRSHVRPNLP